MIGPTCPRCGHIHGSGTRAVVRFSRGPIRYVADYQGAPVRSTRIEAEQDWCRHLVARRGVR